MKDWLYRTNVYDCMLSNISQFLFKFWLVVNNTFIYLHIMLMVLWSVLVIWTYKRMYKLKITSVVYVFQAVDLSSLDASEEDKIQAMMTQSTQDYNPVK